MRADSKIVGFLKFCSTVQKLFNVENIRFYGEMASGLHIPTLNNF